MAKPNAKKTVTDCLINNLFDKSKGIACIKSKVGLSNACSECFAGMQTCGVANCMIECLKAPQGAHPDCTKCMEDKGCFPTFTKCSGLQP